MNYFKVPKANPFQFYELKELEEMGLHFDDILFAKQIRDYERKVIYKQKWKKAETTPIQVESSVVPDKLKVLNKYGETLKEFDWVLKFAATTYGIYETTYDVSDLDEDTIFLYGTADLGIEIAVMLSEPIEIRTSWPRTMSFRYYNSYNEFDVAFTTGVQFLFRCEADIYDYEPKRDRNDYTNQRFEVKTIKATPIDEFKLYIGDNIAVAPWVLNKLNRIFCCNFVSVNGKQFETKSGSDWNITRVRGYPLIGANIEVVPGKNLTSLEFTDQGAPAGLILGYNIETDFFGPGAIVPVIQIENNE